METITLSKKQQHRAQVLTLYEARSIDTRKTVELLQISPQHARRLRARFGHEKMACLVHGNSNRPPVNRTDPVIIDRIAELAGKDGIYHDFNTCHLKDMLAEENIQIGRSTLDRQLKKHHLRKPGRKKRLVKRQRRQRASKEGTMLQMDGSLHPWLEERGPRMTLLAAIDDARGILVDALFRPTEDQAGYLMMLRNITRNHGIPECFYHDKHTILRSPKEPTLEEQLAGKEPQSQVQRVMQELGSISIAANSPQAKGRIEKLWDTLQDRLVKEMRVAEICTIEQANAFLTGYLPRFNARFGVEPTDGESAWVSVDGDMDMDYYFSARQSRVVRPDHTVSWHGKTLQILREKSAPSLAGKTIHVHVTPEDTIHLYDRKQRLAHHPLDGTPKQPIASKPKTARKAVSPADPGATARRNAWLELHRPDLRYPASAQSRIQTTTGSPGGG